MKYRTGVLPIILIFFLLGCGGAKNNTAILQKISPAYNNIRSVISTTGTIQPQNRLELKPPINGRLDEVLVEEGDRVKKGQTLAWMSSTERAALLDSARTQGKDVVAYWQNVYKPTPLISPINGEVIVRSLEPGQIILQATAVLVLSDRLIIKAQVDETDIGRVKLGQSVEISLDAYPDKTFPGTVDHIAYESTLINNVNIYNVDILPKRTAGYIRSGMGANVSIIEKQKEHVLTLPIDAVKQENGTAYVLLFNGANGAKPKKQNVTLGMSDEKQVEILEGLAPSAQVLAQVSTYKVPAKKATGSNPFMPARRSR